MVWARIDDEILDNPKIARAGIFGFAMHVAGIVWCCRNLSDGEIPVARVRSLLTLDRVQVDSANPFALIDGPSSLGGAEGLDPLDVADHLVECGLWERGEGIYIIHDFLEYNPSKKQVLAERSKLSKRRSDAGSKGAASRWQGHGKRDGKRDGKPMANGMANASQSDGPDPVPDPLIQTPPTPTGGGVEFPERESRTIRVVRNASADGANGMSVAAWCDGIGSVTGETFDLPTHNLQRRLVACFLQRKWEGDIVENARAAGVAYARAHQGRTLNEHDYVRWEGSGRPDPSNSRSHGVSPTQPVTPAQRKLPRAPFGPRKANDG